MGSRGLLGAADSSKDAADYPYAVLVMIVGPHSGFTLHEILEMKLAEERILGHMYWGYAGSLCHPQRVQDFGKKMQKEKALQPKLVMVETKSPYVSKAVGRIQRWSRDGIVLEALPPASTLIGCTAALTCKNLRVRTADLDLNQYVVADGKRAGSPLGGYLRYQINKACATRAANTAGMEPRVVSTVAIADIIEPYCVYLAA